MTNLQQWIALIVALDAASQLPAYSAGVMLRVPDGKLPSIVVPPIIDTRVVNGKNVYLYADGSVATDAFNAYKDEYTGPNEKCYGIFPNNVIETFGLTQQNNAKAYGNCWSNRAQTHSLLTQGINWSNGGAIQGVQGTTNPDGHGFVGHSSALRGTLATRLNIEDIDTVLLPAWQKAGFHPSQIDGSTSGSFYSGVAK